MSNDEPFFNNDETRHVMTGVFVRDFLADAQWRDPIGYAVRYYLQYPALGLLVWPPLFYILEGVAMLAFGISMWVPRCLVAIAAAVACVYLFRLVSASNSASVAALAAALFGFSPQVFVHSHYVMLEVPALSLALAALFHFNRYLDQARRRDIWIASLAAPQQSSRATRQPSSCRCSSCSWRFAALGGCSLAGRSGSPRRWRPCSSFRLSLWLPSSTARFKPEMVAGGSAAPASSRLPIVDRLAFYPMHAPGQVGWAVCIAAMVGLLAAARTRATRMAPFGALLVVTYVVFTAIAEVDARHTIWWTPALAVLAAEGVVCAGRIRRMAGVVSGAVVVGVTIWSAAQVRAAFVEGYADAAGYVVAETTASRFCLFDAWLNGDFIYQVRRLDPARRLWVLRGDKLLYSTIVDVDTDYVSFVKNDDDIRAVLDRYAPEFIVVEDPPVSYGYRRRSTEVLLERDAGSIPARTEVSRVPAAAATPSTACICSCTGTWLLA